MTAIDRSAYFDRMAQALRQDGYCVSDESVPEELLWALYRRIGPHSEADFKRAGIGRADSFRVNTRLRSDRIHWLNHDYPAESAYLYWMEDLRLELKQRLLLGLFDVECHFARYAPGGYYKKHLDAFAGNTNRILSTVLYLNPEWKAEWGGELCLYRDFDAEAFLRITPAFGKFVVFLSERFPHEVLPATHQRYSIAGWFRVNQVV